MRLGLVVVCRTDILAKRLNRSSDLLRYRRLNWEIETNHRIRWELEAFVGEAQVSKVPIAFALQQYDNPNEGVVQLSPLPALVGVVNRRFNPAEIDDTVCDEPVVETGGEFVASLSVLGYVHFIVRPRLCDRTRPHNKEIILDGPLDPANVSQSVIRSALRKYLLVLRDSSVVGMRDTISISERAQILWIYLCDIRRTHQLVRSVLNLKNEWSKAFVAAVIASAISLIVGYLVAKGT